MIRSKQALIVGTLAAALVGCTTPFVPRPSPAPTKDMSGGETPFRTPLAFLPQGEKLLAQAPLVTPSNARLVLVLDARLHAGKPGTDQTFWIQIDRAGEEKPIVAEILLNDEWFRQQIVLPGTFTSSNASITARIFDGESRPPPIEIRECSVSVFPAAADPNAIVESRAYPGQSLRAGWRAEAIRRIEDTRRTTVRIHVTDAHEAPVKGVMVGLTLLHPDIKIVAELQSSKDSPPEGTLINAWSASLSSSWDTTTPIAPETPLPVEGGTILPLDHSRNHPLRDATLQPGEQLAKLKQRIEATLRPYAEATMNWDFSDSLSRHLEALDALAPDALEQLLATAHRVAPKASVFLHDFGILEAGPRQVNDYLRTVIELQGSGVLLSGLSVTLESFRTSPAPAEIIARLDRLAETGLPLRIAPLGFVGAWDPTCAERAAADMLLAVLSQPRVCSVVIRDAQRPPWNQVLAKPPGRLTDWMPGRSYQVRTGPDGQIQLRLPAGLYRVAFSARRGIQYAEIQVKTGAVEGMDFSFPVEQPLRPSRPSSPQ